MQKIGNYNCEGMCIEKCCSQRYTHFMTLKINEIELVLSFCKEHSEVFENFILKKLNEHGVKIGNSYFLFGEKK